MPLTPVTHEVAAALASFFRGGQGTPTHDELTDLFKQSGVEGADPAKTPTSDGRPPSKEVRVRRVLGFAADHQLPSGAGLVQALLAALRARGCFDPNDVGFQGRSPIVASQRAFEAVGWQLDDQGHLTPAVLSSLDHHQQRPAIEVHLDRLRRAVRDAPLLIGIAKEVLETTAYYVLDELGRPVPQPRNFPSIMGAARSALGMTGASTPASAKVRDVYDGLWKVASAVNELRNIEGTGHGRIHPSTVPPEVARVVVQAAGLMAALMLETLDAQQPSRQARPRDSRADAAEPAMPWWRQAHPETR